jgi:hypothetical protein
MARLATALAALFCMLGIAAQAASASSPADGHPYRHGVVPEHGRGGPNAAAPLPWNSSNAAADTRSRHNRHNAGAASTSANNLSYGGGIGGVGVTTGAPEVYVVFWGSQWGTASTDAGGYTNLTGDPSGIAPVVQKFFRGLGTEQPNQLWSGVMTQFCEGIPKGSQVCPSGSAQVGTPPASGSLKGVWVDNAAAAPSAASGKQIAQEAVNAAAHFGKPGSASRNAQYVIVSPHGTNPDNYKAPAGGYCAWHDYTADSTLSGGGAASTLSAAVAFTNLPYLTDVGATCGANFVNSGAAGAVDGVTIVGGHEYAETITDQFPAGGWTDSLGNENGDKCAWIKPGQAGGAANLVLSTGSFPVQTNWGNDGNGGAGACQMTHPIVSNAPSSGKLAFQGLPATFAAGGNPSGQVQLRDANNAPLAASSDLVVALTSTGSGAFAPTSVTIPKGQSSSAAFNYTDTKAETTTVTVSASGYTSGTQSETVTAAPAETLSVSPASATVGVGGGQVFTASGSDHYGNPADVSATSWSTNAPGTLSTPTGTSTIFSATTTGSGNVTAKLGPTLVASASVTVTAQPMTNGGFETGNFSGWTIPTAANKPTPVVATARPHAGRYSAQLGFTPSTGEPTGDSAIQQQLAVPAAGGTLSFWVWRYSRDTITYDWQTCEIRNPAGTRLATVFKTASNAQTWQQQTYSLNAWKSQNVVVWCNVHEDGWGDQTYMYADDFAVQ